MDLVQRAKNIILTPRSEWEVIAPETTTTADLYRSYIAPLAAIGPVAKFIGLSIFGISTPLAGHVRVPIGAGLFSAIASYLFSLVGVFIVALVIDALAPTFSGAKSRMQALKVAAYSYTPAWVGAVVFLVPVLGIIALIAALYGLYVLYLGLPVLMRSPLDKAAAYTAVVIVCVIVVYIVIGVLVGTIAGVVA